MTPDKREQYIQKYIEYKMLPHIRNSSGLYESGLREEYDYVVCPRTKLRMDKITSEYVKHVLGMNMGLYRNKYPTAIFCSYKYLKTRSKMFGITSPEYYYFRGTLLLLYRKNNKLGIDYLICPHNRHRIQHITNLYIRRIGFTRAKFIREYPKRAWTPNTENRIIRGVVLHPLNEKPKVNTKRRKKRKKKNARHYRKMIPNVTQEMRDAKLKRFQINIRYRYPDLYTDDDLILGVDYLICPHTKLRLKKIDANYIRNTLLMTVAEYTKLYPNTQRHRNQSIYFKDGLEKTAEEKRKYAVDWMLKIRKQN